jgi:anti-sigma-K factor RskA
LEELKEYIESGILELYVLGQLSATESNEVEAMAIAHPEIKAEITAIEIAMENYAMQNTIAPSHQIKEKILNQISKNTAQATPTETKIIPLYEGQNDNKIRTLRFALIACSVLLVISLGFLFSAHKDLNIANTQIATLSIEKEQFATTVSKLEFNKAGMENQIAMFETTEWNTIRLAGVANSPKAQMVVYWNKKDKSILINHTAMNLPKTDSSHEYQLWALVDGKPVSLGVFGENAKEAVQQMETIQKAQAFAVTIEPMGGSANPTMEKMLVMGAISI